MAEKGQASYSSSSGIDGNLPSTSLNPAVSMRELEREISDALNRRRADIHFMFHPDVVPYYHVLMSMLCVLVLCATSSWYLDPRYTIPSYLANGRMTYSPAVFYLDVVFAAMGLPLLSDLVLDIFGHFVAADTGNDLSKRMQTSGKAKEWCLRLQFIAAFSLTSVARLLGPQDPGRAKVMMYLTQFVRTLIICLYGMFSYTDTFDTTPTQYLRSLGVSAMFVVSHLPLFYGRYAS